MKRPQLISAGSLSRLIQAAADSWNRHDYQQSIELLERASRLGPANSVVLLDLGRAYGMRYDYAAAERCFDRAANLAPRKTDAFAMAGLHCRNFGRYEMSRHYFERAIAAPGAAPDTFVKLAELYERFRFLTEANELVNRALELDGTCAMAVLVRSRLDRLAGKLDDAERHLRPLLAKTGEDSWSTRIRGWYELGAVLDRQERYDEAMGAFLEAKALVRPAAAQYASASQSVRARLKEAETNISADVLRRWFEAGEAGPAPHRLAVLCGHPRSGTTLLEQVLDSHPDMVSAEETPIFVWEAYLPLNRGLPKDSSMLTVLESASPDAVRQSRETYFRSMEKFLGQPVGQRLLIDKNPSLTELIPGVVRVVPEAKFVMALRDPRDVCLSCFMQPLPLNQVSATFMNLAGTVGEYTSVMGLWRSLAPRLPNPHLEVRYEDLVEDLEGVSRRALEFLGVQWDECVLRFNEHARKKLVRSPTYADVAKPVTKGAVGRWRNYQKHLEPSLEALSPFIKAFGYE
ncbi:MAG: Sulfotransferase [Pedosphaera sp.]|nr:Sulfotransferase [Pedosphaera sp.]